MTHPHRLTPDVEATTALPAVTPAAVDEEKLAAVLDVAAGALLASSPDLTPVPGPVPAADPPPAEAGRLDDPIADALHLVDCACPDPYAAPGHVEQYAPLAEVTRRAVLAGVAPRRWPVEAKVKAGAQGTVAVSTVVVGAQLLLDAFGVFPPLFEGRYPWVVAVVLLFQWLLPVVIGTAEAYAAPHTPRPTVVTS